MKKAVVSYGVYMLVVGLSLSRAVGANLTIPAAGRVSVELIFSDAAFRNTLSVLSPAVGVAISGCALEPAVGLPGVHVVSEKISQHGCRVDLDADTATAGIQGFAANTTFEFRFCAQADADADCEFVWSSDPTQNTDTFDHVMTTPLFPTTFPGQIFQLAWEDLENGGDQDFNDLIAVVRVTQDTDGDGLWDDWEQFGIDTDGDGTIDLDLPALGADPMRQDIFVEIDFMDCTVAGGDCAMGDTHSHQPKAAAVQAVIDSFANAPIMNPDGSMGISLHIDVDDAISHQNFVALGCGFGSAGFDAVKAVAANFGPTNPRRFAYHYAVFGHRQAATTTSSGCAERPGNDFLATLGEWNTACILAGPNGMIDTTPAGDDVRVNGTTNIIYTGPNLTCNTTAAGDDFQLVANGNAPTNDRDGDGLDDRTVGTIQQQAGTLMHEFGHNLNLRHGGDEAVNYKPNYISIMNYAFQTRGIPPTDPDGTGPLTARVDYSPDDLADLNENNLNEPAGIGDGTDNTRYACPGGTQAGTVGLGTGPIDWNCDSDGGADASVAVDISGDGTFGVLTGFDDWGNLKLDFQNTTDFEDGVHDTSIDIVEIDHATHMQIPQDVGIDIKPFSDPNSISTSSRGVIPVAICNGGAVLNSVDIDDPSDPNGFSNAATNIDVSTLMFAFATNGNPLATMTAPAAHDLGDLTVLGLHLTEFIDTNADGIPDTLVPLDVPNCPDSPAGPDLVVHFPTQDTGLALGDTEACVKAALSDGTVIIGCDAVNIVK